ncbi:MAG: dodecin family protein [Rubrobacteraceae bacterium]|uniref:dodecin n=1 Tax=Rubrobacter naiadicus TaxID=1392641 RepID=UPI0023610E4C|nr:dodecin [Rubrobacter naiadicus]MBX6762980.1 dodecin domain-containing protein [Rubrobacteraceae bacterium]MCL6438017.1 dodecin family protein [Rubrobacteraceae bacterium]
MSADGNKLYQKTEVVGTSEVSFEDAIARALERARRTIHHVRWFEVVEQRGRVDDGRIEFQITLEIGSEVEESP